MLKLALAVLAVSGCALLGRACAAPLYRRAALLGELRDALALLRIRMLDAARPLPEALEDCGAPLLRRLGAGLADGDPGVSWQALRRRESVRGGLLDSLLPADLETLDAFFAGLGATDNRGQACLIEEAEGALKAREAEARQRCGEKGRLYTTLGLLGGLALALLAY